MVGKQNAEVEVAAELDREALAAWMQQAVGPGLIRSVRRFAGGHSSGAWRVDRSTPDGDWTGVLKAPELPSVVYLRDAVREGLILREAARLGVPVPAVLAIDSGAQAMGRPCFVMEYVEGRSLCDTSAGSYHDDPWLRTAGSSVQRSIWNSFHGALARLHGVDAAAIRNVVPIPAGSVEFLDYWRGALLDAAPPETVPRQLALIEWLRQNVPVGADDSPALCMGDARLVNALVREGRVRALVDFEVAFIGNPASDIGYSLFLDSQHRQNTENPLDFPSADDTWRQWSEATGRPVTRREYWTAFAATILCVTATRAMIQWGMAGPSVEDSNPVVGAWERAVALAAAS
jgi:aminoglycoside phosphotransferase (APT) family kinase protein